MRRDGRIRQAATAYTREPAAVETSTASPLVAYQGEPGAFSDDAAAQLVPGAATQGSLTFDDMFTALAQGAVAYAVVPIENSITGAITRNYDLLWQHPELVVTDELAYRVVQALIGTADAELSTIREVRSHPVALEQCRNFLATHPTWRAHVVHDTAGAVRGIVQENDPTVAAIAGRTAAHRYGARILQDAIQDMDENFTRFFLVRHRERDAGRARARGAAGRACIAVALDAERRGSLRDALACFADAGLNLRSLVARPALDRPFTYRFYLEVEGLQHEQLAEVIASVDGSARILGEY